MRCKGLAFNPYTPPARNEGPPTPGPNRYVILRNKKEHFTPALTPACAGQVPLFRPIYLFNMLLVRKVLLAYALRTPGNDVRGTRSLYHLDSTATQEPGPFRDPGTG